MASKLFQTEHLPTISGEAPVRQELTRRLTERLSDLKSAPANLLTLNNYSLPEPTASLDVLVADMVLPTVEDVPLHLFHYLQALKPDGLLLASTLGTESFHEFRSAWAELGEPTGHIIPLTDVREAGALLQRLKMALPVVDRDIITLTFPDFPTLYASLRTHGIRNISTTRRKGLTTSRKLRAMEDTYRTLFPRADDRLPLTLEIIYLHAYKQAENQPQPAKRGSGKVSLVRILENPEA